MVDTFQRVWQNIYLRVILIISVVYGLFWLIQQTQLAWTSFLIAFLIAYLVEPIVLRLERTRIIRRWFSVTLVIVFIFLFLVVSVLLLREVVLRLAVLLDDIPPLLAQLTVWVEGLETNAPPLVATLLADNAEGIQDLVREQQAALSRWARDQGRRFPALVGTVFGYFGRALLIVALAGFIISGYDVIKRGFVRMFPPRYRVLAHDIAAKLNKSVGGYVRAKFVESVIVGLFVWVVLLLMGIPSAAPLAFLVGLLNPVPYLGPFVASIPVVLSALTISWQLALTAFFVMGIIQVLDGNILQPILLSQNVSVHPVTVLVALVTGGALLGVWGVLLAIPIAAFLSLIYTDYYLKSKWYLGRNAPLMDETDFVEDETERDRASPAAEKLEPPAPKPIR